MMDGWINKKVYIETFSGRKYCGIVTEESEIKLILIDKFNNKVELSKVDIKLCQEELK